jgi:uncharacterized protein YndB with AHSA1/START domain
VFLIAIVPFFLVADSLTGGKATVEFQSSEIVIDAPAEQVWPYLSNLPSVKSDFWMFRAGVAHALRVSTKAPIAGSERECVLSTGVMHETITEWVPNRRLAFKVLSTPPSMREMNPFGEVHAAHLRGWYESLEGSFTLVPLPDGRVKLIGASRYQHKFRPVSYWNLWTDKIVREIQL